MKTYLENHLDDKIKVHFIKHPITNNPPIKFNYEKFASLKEYEFVLLGRQLRYVSTLFYLTTSCNKVWLTNNDSSILKDGISALAKKQYTERHPTPVPNAGLNSNISFKHLSDNDYDKYITENIILIDLQNASANNSVLEMIVTCTPFFVNKIPAVIDYIGEDYPLYFDNVSDIENVINDRELLLEKYKITHQYLTNLDKTDISYEHFNSEMLKIINC